MTFWMSKRRPLGFFGPDDCEPYEPWQVTAARIEDDQRTWDARYAALTFCEKVRLWLSWNGIQVDHHD